MRALVDPALKVAATLDLPAASVSSLVEVAPADASALLAAARREGLVGLLDQALASGLVSASGATAGAIGDAAVEVAAWSLRVERHALGVASALSHAGLEHRFLKGFTIAHRFEDHPALRSFADVDVLVRGGDLDRAVDLLLSFGHERLQPEWRAGFVARFGKSVTVRSPGGVEVDVHRTFAAGPYGVTGDPGVVWARPSAQVAVGGVELPCLDVSSAFVHACVHVVAGQEPRVASMRDVALLALHDDLDLEAVADLEAGLGVAACVTEGVGRTWSVLGLDPLPVIDALGARLIRRRDRRWLDLYADDASFRRMAIEALRAVPSMGGRARYVAAVVPRRAGSTE